MLRQLEYLVALANLRHFGRAAYACHVSQSTLSQQLRALEDRLGVALIERRTSGAELTPIRGCLRGCLSDDCRPDSDRGSPSDRVTACRCGGNRSEEHTSELQSLMRISYAVFCLKKKIQTITN